MATNDSVNMKGNADGGQVSMGLAARILKWLGADITLTGTGAAVVTFPAATSTLFSNLDAFDRNAIINGALDVWQRGTTTLTNPATTTYFPDRFSTVHVLGDGTFNLLASAETPSATFPFQYSLQHDTTHIETAVAAGEYSTLQYKVEGYDFRRFEVQQATLSFWVKAVKAGIYCVAFRNSAANKSYVHEFTINAANTWELKTVTLTFNSAGTFLYTTGIGLIISWAVMCGSTFQIATANKDTWQTGNYMATDAQVNGMDNTANNFYLTGVQMELGSVATPFEFRHYEAELLLCQRYYSREIATSTYHSFATGFSISTTRAGVIYNYRVRMRDVPVLTASGSFALYTKVIAVEAVTTGPSAVGATQGYDSMLIDAYITGANLTIGYATNLLANNDAAAYLAFNAEL